MRILKEFSRTCRKCPFLADSSRRSENLNQGVSKYRDNFEKNRISFCPQIIFQIRTHYMEHESDFVWAIRGQCRDNVGTMSEKTMKNPWTVARVMIQSSERKDGGNPFSSFFRENAEKTFFLSPIFFSPFPPLLPHFMM